ALSCHDKVARLFKQWKEGENLSNEELIIRTATGEERIVLLNVSAVRDEWGELIHSVSIQTDITELKQTVAELKREMARLEMTNEHMVNRELKMVELKKEIKRLKDEGRRTKDER
ncbi:MAG: PAS domain S-box protein, partial [Bacteroidia bacterium]|nr:PAS domain S-box protein [Bacteroidia bacterium]